MRRTRPCISKAVSLVDNIVKLDLQSIGSSPDLYMSNLLKPIKYNDPNWESCIPKINGFKQDQKDL